MTARLCGFDCDSVIDEVSDCEGAVVVDIDADGDCDGESAGEYEIVADPVIDRLGRDVVVSHSDMAPLKLCTRVADVVIVAAVRVTAALKLKLGEGDSLRETRAEADTDTERDATRVLIALCEFVRVVESDGDVDELGELVRVTCVALDETDGVCVDEYAGDFESKYRSDGLTVAVTAADADRETVARMLPETDEDDVSDTDGVDDDVIEVDFDRVDVIEGELECVALGTELPVASDRVVVTVAVAAPTDGDAEPVVDRVLDSTGVAEPDNAAEYVALSTSLRVALIVIVIAPDAEFVLVSVTVAVIIGVTDSPALTDASPDCVPEAELDGVSDSVACGVSVGRAGDGDELAVTESKLTVGLSDDVCVGCFTVALVDGLELKLARDGLAVLESNAERDTADFETKADRDGGCSVRVAGGDGDVVEHTDVSALWLLDVDAHGDADGLPVRERETRAEVVMVIDALPDFDIPPVVDSCVVAEALAVFTDESVIAVTVGDVVAIERLPEADDDHEADGDGVALELVEMDCVGIDAKGDAEFELHALRL